MSGTSPKQIGRYQILDRLAVGGMAELFKAQLQGNLGYEKLVAIKKILPHLANDRSFVEMFIDAARITAQLALVFGFGASLVHLDDRPRLPVVGPRRWSRSPALVRVGVSGRAARADGA